MYRDPKIQSIFIQIISNVIRKFKVEANGKIIIEFLDLRPKMYNWFIDDDEVNIETFISTKSMKKPFVKDCIYINVDVVICGKVNRTYSKYNHWQKR